MSLCGTYWFPGTSGEPGRIRPMWLFGNDSFPWTLLMSPPASGMHSDFYKNRLESQYVVKFCSLFCYVCGYLTISCLGSLEAVVRTALDTAECHSQNGAIITWGVNSYQIGSLIEKKRQKSARDKLRLPTPNKQERGVSSTYKY